MPVSLDTLPPTLLAAAAACQSGLDCCALATDGGYDPAVVAHAVAHRAPPAAWDAATVTLVAPHHNAAVMACGRADLPTEALLRFARTQVARLADAEGRDGSLESHGILLGIALRSGRIPFQDPTVERAAAGAGIAQVVTRLARGGQPKALTARASAFLQGVLRHPDAPPAWLDAATVWWEQGGAGATMELLVTLAAHPVGPVAALQRLAERLRDRQEYTWNVLWEAPRAAALRQDPRIRRQVLSFARSYISDDTISSAAEALTFVGDAGTPGGGDASMFLTALVTRAPRAVTRWLDTPDGQAAAQVPEIAAVLADVADAPPAGHAALGEAARGVRARIQ